MSTLTDTTEIVAADDCLSTTIDGESVILHMGTDEYYGFNEVGTFVWESIQEPRSLEAVCEDVTDEYEVEYDRCRADVEELVRDLADKGLARIDPE
ncbi:PqqD family protein [Halobellus ruber]